MNYTSKLQQRLYKMLFSEKCEQKKAKIRKMITKSYGLTSQEACVILRAIELRDGLWDMDFKNGNDLGVANSDSQITAMPSPIDGSMTKEIAVDYFGLEIPLETKRVQIFTDENGRQCIRESQILGRDCPHISIPSHEIVLDASGHRICKECVLVCSRNGCQNYCCRKCAQIETDRQTGSVSRVLCEHHNGFVQAFFLT